MRIEKVVIENINSLAGHFEIDFSADRYAEGLFAIVGPSGSGKSTVLDAMCLAVYGKTPRIRAVSKTTDEVMNKNADKCSAAVFFWSKGMRYKSSFLHKRAKGKEPFAQAVREVLRFGDDGEGEVIASGKTECDAAIKDITGLDYSRFTRSIMLAQFQFAEFLKADGGARAEILEQISDMDIYRKISIAVYERKKHEDKLLDNIRVKQGAITVLAEEDEKRLKVEHKDIGQQTHKLDTLQQQFALCRDTIGEIEKLKRDAAKYAKEKTGAQDALKTQKQRHEKAQAEGLAAEKSQSELAQTLKEVRTLDQSIVTVDNEIVERKREIEAFKKTIVEKMNDAKTVFTKYMPDADKSEMRQMFESGDVTDKIRAQAEADLKRAKEKEDALKQKIKKTLRGKTEAYWQSRAELLGAAMPVVRAQRAVAIAQTERETQRAKIVLLEKDAATQRKEEKQIEEKFVFAKLQEKFGEERKALIDGQPCPLCGATQHPGVSEQDNQAYLIAITQQRSELRKAALNTQKEIAAAKRSTQTLDKTISEQRGVLEQGKDELSRLGAKIEDIGHDPIDDATESRIREERADIATMMRDAAALRVQANEIGKEVLTCTARLGDVSNDALRVQHAKQAADEAAQRKAEKQTQLNAATDTRSKLTAKRIVLFGEKDAETEERKAAQYVHTVRQAVEKARDALEKAKSRTEQADKDIARTQKDIEAQQGKLDTVYRQAKANIQIVLTDGNTEIAQTAKRLGDSATESKEAIITVANSLQSLVAKQMQRTGELKSILHRNEEDKRTLGDLRKQEKQQEKVRRKWETINKLIGSADGKQFSRIAQGITFEVLLKYANHNLAKMSDRYVLVRDMRDRSKPLEIAVADSYQAGDIRPVSNLSGGESFVVSMALALGLSEMSSNRTRIDSLFIDEGFASLDEDYLESALETLSTLGNREGKLVGVISHVAALKERIDTQIEVTPLSGGASTLSGPGVTVME